MRSGYENPDLIHPILESDIFLCSSLINRTSAEALWPSSQISQRGKNFMVEEEKEEEAKWNCPLSHRY